MIRFFTVLLSMTAAAHAQSTISADLLEELSIPLPSTSSLPTSAGFGFSTAATDLILAVGAPRDPGLQGTSPNSGAVLFT